MLPTLALAAALLLQQPDAPGKLRWVPNPTKTTRGWVSDPARHLQPATVAAIDSVIFALERETSAELAVVVIDSLDGMEPADAALLLHRRWGVGKRDRNNGLLFLWSPALRKLHVSVGYRLEGVLPDSRVGRILDGAVLPRFRREAFDEGVLAGVQALAAAAREEVAWNEATGVPAYHPSLTDEVAELPGEAQPAASGPRDDGDGSSSPLMWILGGVGAALVAGGGWAVRRRHAPPPCPGGHGPMTRLDEAREDAHLGRGEQDEERVGSIDWDVWTCGRCDAVVLRPHEKWFSGIERCSKCKRKTLRSTRRTLRAATTMSEGLEEVTTTCAHCGATRTTRVETARLQDRSTSSFGGGGGSSFGGGSAGGGGAGRSY